MPRPPKNSVALTIFSGGHARRQAALPAHLLERPRLPPTTAAAGFGTCSELDEPPPLSDFFFCFSGSVFLVYSGCILDPEYIFRIGIYIFHIYSWCI